MSTIPETPTHKPGDVVNGHRLTAQADGSLQWLPMAAEPLAGKKKKARRGLWITLGVVGGLIVVSSIATAVNGSASGDAAINKPAAGQLAEPAAAPVEVTVPDVTGQTASAAVATLQSAGFETAGVDDPDAIVTATTPAQGQTAPDGSTVALTVEVKPKLTLPQQNAVGKAKSYVQYQAFSRSGLIGQLEFEGFSTEDATFGVDYIAPDWNAQAAAKAKSYLDIQSFSREGLYDQLIFEGYSDAEANAGLAAVGY
jgi:hypothetical protein